MERREKIKRKLICHGRGLLALLFLKGALGQYGRSAEGKYGRGQAEEKDPEGAARIRGSVKALRNKGIDIFIDGKMTRQEREWYRIFEVREDGAVYMADYVNSRQGRLSEIHFDLVYLDLSAHQAWENKKRLEDAMRKAQVQHYKTVLQKQQRS